jgi:tripartite-type tricarboxylate transporter receptor subunit TctC
MKSFIRNIVRLGFVIVLIRLGTLPAAADDIASFYKGKQIRLVMGYAASSGHSLYGQLLSRHLGTHIPGNPIVVPQNMPGAGSLVAANWLYNVAPKDGSVIGVFAINIAIDSLYEESKAKFDATKFNWIGSMAPVVSVCAVSPKAPIHTFDELLKTELLFGATGPSGGTFQYAIALKHLLGAKIKIVSGYKAGQDIMLAMERGEVQGGCAFPLATNLEQIKSGELIPIIKDSMEETSVLPKIPSVYKYAKTTEDRQVFDLVFGWHALGRPVSAPPDMPAARLKALQQAFIATMKDPKFLADAKKSSLEIEPTPGPEMADMVRRFLSYPKSVVEKAGDAVRE